MKYRPEIDGLRAFAVLSVVGFHAFPSWITGGFIGVDVFFVISGYLITRIIFEELDRAEFKLSVFFARRIRRIFPALLCVLIAVLGFGWYGLLSSEYAQLGKHVFGGAAFLLNFILVSEAGYFDTAADLKPLLHLWSLAVEEQFYIVWPILLWVFWKRNTNLLVVTLVVITLSFLVNLFFLATKPVQTFFWPFGRFWELLCGSLLAWLMLYKDKDLSRLYTWFDRFIMPKGHHQNTLWVRLPALLAGLGHVMLFLGAFLIDEDMAFPGFVALVPVIGAMMIILSGSTPLLNRFALMNPVAIWFGKISYPLYLWHWPFLAFLLIMNGGETAPATYRFGAILLSIFAAWATYALIEKPIRTRVISKPIIVSLLSGLIIVGLTGAGIWKGLLPSRDQLLYPSEVEVRVHLPPAEDEKKDCLTRLGIPDKTNIRYCSISSDQDPDIALIGDSHSAALYPGLAHYLEKEQNRSLLNLAGRLFPNVVNYPTGDALERAISSGAQDVADYILSNDNLKTIVMSNRGFFYLSWADNYYLKDAPDILDKKEVYKRGLRYTLDLFKDRHVIFILENPTLNFNINKCSANRPVSLVTSDFQCAITRSDDDSLHREYINEVMTILNDYSNVVIVDPRDVLCDPNYCHAKKDGKLLYIDKDHLNGKGSLLHGKQVADVIASHNF